MPLSNEAIQGLLAFGAGTLANNTGNYGMFGPAVGKGGLLGLQQYGNAQQNSLLTRRQEQDERFRTFQMEDANIARKLQFQKMQEDAENQKRVNEMLMRILGGGPQAQPGPQVAPPQFSPNSVQDALVMGGGPTRKADAILQGSPQQSPLSVPPIEPEGERMVDPNVLARGGLAMAGLDPRIAQTLLSGANFYQGAQQADVAAQERQLTADRGRLTPVSGMPGIFVNNDNEKYYKWGRDSNGSLVEQELTTDELEAMNLRGRKASATNVSVNTKEQTEEAKAVGKAAGELYSDIQKAGFNAQSQIDRLTRIGNLLEGVDTGKLTPTATNIASYAASIGINIDKNLGNKQAAEALANEIALTLRNPSSGAGMPGAMSDKDREFLMSMVPGLEKTPQGRKTILETAKKLAQRQKEVAKLARDYRKKNGQMDDGFYDVLSDFSAKNPLFEAVSSGGEIDDLIKKYTQ